MITAYRKKMFAIYPLFDGKVCGIWNKVLEKINLEMSQKYWW